MLLPGRESGRFPLADRAYMTPDEIECIEEAGTKPTIALLRRLAVTLDATYA
jgi:hypothetical protein